jgi:hypothetical protein
VPFAHGELIHSDVANPCEFSLLQTSSQIFLENPFDQIPSYSQQFSYSLNGSDGAQLNNKTLEGFQTTAFGVGKINRLPQHTPAASAVLFMPMKDDLLCSASNGQCMEDPGEPTGLMQMVPTGSTAPAQAFCVFQPHMMENRPLTVFCTHVPVFFQAQGMVKITCRRHDRSPRVSGVLQLITKYRFGDDLSIASLPRPFH